MNYTAVNTKIKAMYAGLFTSQDYKNLCANPVAGLNLPTIQDDFAKILPYIYKKNILRFVANYRGSFSDYATKHGISALDKSSRESLKRVAGTETDLQNILWLYRLKRYHKIEGDAVFAFLNPTCYMLNAEELTRVSVSKNLDEFAQVVASGIYGGFFGSLESFTRGEQILTRAVRVQLQKESRHENLAVVFEYLYARHLEIKNIRAITEGTKNGLKPEEIFSLLHV